MSQLLKLVVGLLSLSVVPVSAAERVLLDFDGLSPGEYVTDQFIADGVLFEGGFAGNIGTAGLVGDDGDFGTFLFGGSEPNFVIIGVSYFTAHFFDPFSGEPTTASAVRFRAGDADAAPEIVGVNAFDAEGNVIYGRVVHLVEEGATITITRRELGRRGIAELRIFALEPPLQSSGFAIDDFEFVLE